MMFDFDRTDAAQEWHRDCVGRKCIYFNTVIPMSKPDPVTEPQFPIVIVQSDDIKARFLKLAVMRWYEFNVVTCVERVTDIDLDARFASCCMIVDESALHRASEVTTLGEGIKSGQIALVVLSNCNHDALKSFSIGAVDCVANAWDVPRLKVAVSRAMMHLEKESRWEGYRARESMAIVDRPPTQSARVEDRIVVKDREKYVSLKMEDIFVIRADRSRCWVKTAEREYELRKSITEVEHRLNPRIFARVHRSFILNKTKIVEHYQVVHNDRIAVLENGDKVRVSRRYLAALDSFGMPSR
jgi:DNA-binding LytR/AlgR family response regulator